MPIEEMFSKVKEAVRSEAARTTDAARGTLSED